MRERDQALGPAGDGVTFEQAEKVFTKWIQVFRPVLTVSLVNALELQAYPNRCFTHVLMMTLSRNFTASTPLRTDAQIAKAFKLEDAFVVSTEEALQTIPNDELRVGLRSGMDGVIERAKEIQAKEPGRLGVPMMLLGAPGCNLIRLTPCGIEATATDLPPWNADWKNDLKVSLDSGKRF
ncbi:hypothetical protein NLJ89_g11810 [Agrocybe chaxingu]|uniref:Uncharacterized protein n=1 Tax=Agrocybe chaxingu TaxID=84603 RepID=A0A9W8JPC7_9AGAR|nr:hypothetical protein NLJ89_g11810 [Agrocybe chaxingu]